VGLGVGVHPEGDERLGSGRVGRATVFLLGWRGRWQAPARRPTALR
jgi:hypothetical protein